MSKASVGAVLLNWNNFEDTRECVLSLLKNPYPGLRIYVVDNGSVTGDVNKIKELSPEIVVLKNSKNLGFAGGCNTGLRAIMKSGLDYGWLFNNDATADSGTVSELVRFLEEHPRAAFAGSIVYHGENSGKIQSAGGKIRKDNGWGTLIGCDEPDTGQFSEPFEVDYVSGCSLMVRVKSINKIGLLDESFFPIYYEDTDWSLRAQRAGWQTWLVPSSKVWHKDKASTGPKKTIFVYQNYFLFLSKQMPRLLGGALRTHFRRRLFPHILQGQWKLAWNDFLVYWGFFQNSFKRSRIFE